MLTVRYQSLRHCLLETTYHIQYLRMSRNFQGPELTKRYPRAMSRIIEPSMEKMTSHLKHSHPILNMPPTSVFLGWISSAPPSRYNTRLGTSLPDHQGGENNGPNDHFIDPHPKEWSFTSFFHINGAISILIPFPPLPAYFSSSTRQKRHDSSVIQISPPISQTIPSPPSFPFSPHVFDPQDMNHSLEHFT